MKPVTVIRTQTDRRSFVEIIDDLRQMKAWLAELGKTAAGTRLDKYAADIRMIEDARLGDRQRELVQRFGKHRLVRSLVEGFQLSTVFRALRERPDLQIGDKLSMAVEGPALPEDERPATASNRPRNILFELLVAARLTAAGYSPTLGEQPDVAAVVSDIPVFFQCKRVMSMRGFSEAIKNARTQLERDLKAEQQAVGVIAIDLAKAVDTGGGIFLTTEDAAALRLLRRIGDQLTGGHQQAIARAGSRRVVGMLLYFAVPAANIVRNIYAVADLWDWRLIGSGNPTGVSTFRVLVAAMQQHG